MKSKDEKVQDDGIIQSKRIMIEFLEKYEDDDNFDILLSLTFAQLLKEILSGVRQLAEDKKSDGVSKTEALLVTCKSLHSVAKKIEKSMHAMFYENEQESITH